ncbi:MAG: patatin-like phospholipase family protein [Candidatus Altimarinota bacterium]
MIPKKFSLALGGGGARGLAHIGVIRYLEEQNARPIAISGTSMGSIIGTLYALGKSSHQMEDILEEIEWLKLVDFDMKRGLLKGVKVEKYLDGLFEGKSFEDLQIPLTLTATDLDTGEGILFHSGKLAPALRSSIGIPGVFSPKEYQDRVLVDGGLTANLPIEILPEGEVIAVSAMRDLSRKVHYRTKIFSLDWQNTLFSNGYHLMQKTIDIMLSQNENRSVLSRKKVHYIRPEFDGLDYYEFGKYKAFIESGYKKASGVLGALKRNFYFF